MPKPRRSYPEEFRREAVRLIVEQGYAYPQAAERLAVPFHTLKNGVKTRRAAGSLPPAFQPLSEAEERKRLRQEKSRLQMEVVILKKSGGVLREGERELRPGDDVVADKWILVSCM